MTFAELSSEEGLKRIAADRAEDAVTGLAVHSSEAGAGSVCS